nr:gustatory receptor 29 [Papilio xuthus]
MNEYLLNNCIEIDFQKFLYPLNLCNFIVYSPKYNISENFITPNNRKTNCRSFCCAFWYILIYIISLVYNKDFNYYEGILLYLFLIIFIISIGSFVINYIVNSIQSEIHVNFILTINKIQKSFKYVNIDFKSFLIGNWIYMFVLIISYIFMILTHLYEYNFTIVLCLYYISLIICDANIIYLVRVIELLTDVTMTWMSELKYLDNITSDTVNTENTESLNLRQYWNTLIKSYLDITNAASLYEEIARIPIIFYMSADLFNILLHVEVFLMFPDDFWSNAVTGLVWAFKHFLLIVIISFKNEKFFTTLKNTQVMFLIPDSPVEFPDKRLLSKTVLRAGNAACMSRESGAFALDATLPLSLFSCIATYVVVLLQFKLT